MSSLQNRSKLTSLPIAALMLACAIAAHAAQTKPAASPQSVFNQSLRVWDTGGRALELRVVCTPAAGEGGQVRLSLPGGFPVRTRISQSAARVNVVVPGLTLADAAPTFTIRRAGVETLAFAPLSQAIGGLRLDFACKAGTRAFVDFKPGQASLSFTVRATTPATARGTHKIALTFDDFPFPKESADLLAVLRKYNVPATFFCIGHKVELYPDLVREAQQDGHSLQNHTYSHVPLAASSDDRVISELQRCNAAIERVTGVRPRFFRAAGSSFDAHVFTLARRQNLTPVNWTVNVHDYDEPADFIANHVIDSATGQTAVVLLHDGIRATMDALPRIIETLTARGYVFVTVDDLYR